MSEDRENLTWELFGGASRDLSQMVADDGYEPDIVLFAQVNRELNGHAVLPATAIAELLLARRPDAQARSGAAGQPDAVILARDLLAAEHLAVEALQTRQVGGLERQLADLNETREKLSNEIAEASAEIGIQQALATAAEEHGIRQLYVWATEGARGGAVQGRGAGVRCGGAVRGQVGVTSASPRPAT